MVHTARLLPKKRDDGGCERMVGCESIDLAGRSPYRLHDMELDEISQCSSDTGSTQPCPLGYTTDRHDVSKFTQHAQNSNGSDGAEYEIERLEKSAAWLGRTSHGVLLQAHVPISAGKAAAGASKKGI
jgi:hypothetical protein